MSSAFTRSESPRSAALKPAQAAPRERQLWNVAGKLSRFAGHSSARAALFIGLLAALLWAPYLWYFSQRENSERSEQRWLVGRSGLENVELRLLDARFTARGIVVPPSADKIAIVGIDQNSLGRIGRWPWPRALHAQLIDKLKAAGARVTFLDFDFSDRQNPGESGALSKNDRALIAATARAGNVVLPSLLAPETGDNNARTYQLNTPFGADESGDDGLDEQTLDLGLAYLPTDGDGHFRSYPFALNINGETLGGVAPLGAAIYQDLLSADSNARYQNALKRGVWRARDAATATRVPLRSTQFAGANAPQLQNMLIDWAGPSGTFATYSFADVLQGYDAKTLKEKFGGRIVLVGPTAPLLKDVFPCPPFYSRTREVSAQISGVEIHANAVSMLLDGRFLAPPVAWQSWGSLLALALGCAWWAQQTRGKVSAWARALQSKWQRGGRRTRIYDAVWIALYSAFAALPLVLFWWICTLAFRAGHVWMVATYPLGAGVTASALMLMLLFTLESAERRKVVSQLGLYMDTRVVDEILAHPEAQYPRPRRTEATVLFTDIEGFTSYSEAHQAEEVVAALNAFFSRMKPIVVAHGGSIDKFIGDAMMCFFGVPLPRADHAKRALQCALELQEECARFRHETGIPFRMRIGLHSGPLIVGSVGSEAGNGSGAHMNYTVIGDTVNLASRLEAKNKEFGSWIMCSRALGEAAPGVANFVAARTPIKGLSHEVDVLIAIGHAHREARARVWAAQTRAQIEQAEVAIASGLDDENATPALQSATRALTAAPQSPFALNGKGRIFDAE